MKAKVHTPPLARLPVIVEAPSEREAQLQRLLSVYAVTGLLFMLLPGTFLGAWNLISISSDRSAASLSASWLQAHGHAQVFGWIGTFIIGIGYYSLSKMGAVLPFAVSRGWVSWALWTAGLILRWTANVSLWHWHMLLPVSAGLELAGFLIFFFTVSRHKGSERRPTMETWMKLVIASAVALLLALLANLAAATYLVLRGSDPALPHWLDQRFLVLAVWGFPVLAVWGFNARWLPVFLGLPQPRSYGLMAALLAGGGAVAAAVSGYFSLCAALLMAGSLAATFALHVFEPARQPAKTLGVHTSFPVFVRLCYGWLLTAAGLSLWASRADTSGGIWGASRHALTVGFLAGMIFAIGQRVLPAFCGMRVLFSPRLMFVSLLVLNVGCVLRVTSEIQAYEGFWQGAWRVLPYSAVLELAAVALFALNMGLTLAQPPAHLKNLAQTRSVI